MIIEKIVKNTPNQTLNTWGIKDAHRTVYKGQEAAILKVNGLRHNGNIVITEKNGNYDIYLLDNLDREKESRKKIKEYDLPKVINELIERPAEWSDEFYYLQIMNKLKKFENV